LNASAASEADQAEPCASLLAVIRAQNSVCVGILYESSSYFTNIPPTVAGKNKRIPIRNSLQRVTFETLDEFSKPVSLLANKSWHTLCGWQRVHSASTTDSAKPTMKKHLLTLSLWVGLASLANAVPTVINLSAPPVGDIPKNGTGINDGNSNNAENNFFRLETFLASHPGLANGTPIFEGAERLKDNEDVDVTGFSYAVIHYGSGRGGTSGGGIAFFSITGDGTFDFPDDGSGPNGFGGFSSLDLFKGVPDSGTTIALLGAAFCAIGMARRKFGIQSR